MKKTLSAILAASMLLATVPMATIHADSTDVYFTETKTVDYSQTWHNAQAGNGYATAENAANYKFTAGGQTYSLLDVTKDSDSKYFVITDTSVAQFPFYANTDVVNYFDVVSGSGDAHAKKYPSWALNGEYFQKGWVYRNWTGISSTVRDYIDFSHEWTCEKSYSNNEYKITAGITYPSVSEVRTYSDRFLLPSTGKFVMRTLRSQDGARFGVINADASDKWVHTAIALNDDASWQNVRPVFYLNDEFFAEVKIDLATAGAAVKQEIRKQSTSDLVNIYTAEELSTYLGITQDKYFPEVKVDYTKTWNNQQSGNGYATAENAAMYKFSVGTETFSLLDVADDSKSKYFVITDTRAAEFPFYANTDVVNYFDVVSGSGDAHAKKYPSWALNGEYFQKGWVYRNWTGISSTVRDYIDFSHEWTCEKSYSNNEYKITAGITFPSVSEISAYSNRFLVKGASTFVMRTLRNQDGARFGTINCDGDNWKHIAIALNDDASWQNVRPVFWLNENFFENVAVNLSTAGEAVINEIKKIDGDKLVEIYSSSDLKTYLDIDISAYPEILTNSGQEIKYGETVYSTVPAVTWKVDGKEINVSDNSYIITETDAGKVISVEHNVNGKTYKKQLEIPALLNDPHSPNSAVTSAKESENVIYVDGRGFTVIDDFNNSESTFFVVANEIYDKYAVTSRKMNPDESGNVIKYLNGIFKNYGSEQGKKLPESILEYIDNDHVWLTEGTPKFEADPMEAYSFKAGISIPSVSEIKRYADVFGWYATEFDGSEFAKYWTRTAANHATGEWVYVAEGGADSDTKIKMSHWKLDGTTTGIRPVFYLNEDFFRNVAIDNLSDFASDSAVIAMLTSRYSLEEMYELYGPRGQDIFDKEGLMDLGFISDGSSLTVTFENEDGELSTLDEQTTVYAKVAAKAGKLPINTTSIFALYDETGRLVAVDIEAVTADSGEYDNVTLTLSGLSDVTEKYTAKVMFFENLNSLRPEYEPVYFTEGEANPVEALSFVMGAENKESAGGYNFF